jgi:hypothetical protein
VLQLGGVSGLAVFAIIILQKTWEGRLADQQTTQEELTQQRQTLMDVVKGATQAMTDQTAATRESIAASRELCGEVRASLVVVARARKTTAKEA